MKRPLAEAKMIQKKFEDEVFLPNRRIVSVGLGINQEADDYTLEISVEDEEVKNSLPTSFEGLELVIETTGGVNFFG